MKMIRTLGLAAVLLGSTQVATAASVVPNMGFESGLAGWTAVAGTGGSAGFVSNPVEAFEGNNYGRIAGNGALTTFANVIVGNTYDFMFRFITTDYDPFDDQAVLFKINAVSILANVIATGNISGNTYDSGWQYFSFVSPVTTQSGMISFSLYNALDSAEDSQLLLDATVPLPGAALLFGSALLGAGALRRKQAAAKKAALAAA